MRYYSNNPIITRGDFKGVPWVRGVHETIGAYPEVVVSLPWWLPGRVKARVLRHIQDRVPCGIEIVWRNHWW